VNVSQFAFPIENFLRPFARHAELFGESTE
jgi:hypothetical protein